MKEFILFVEENWVSITGAIIGLLYLYFEYKARIWMWPASIVMSAFYIYIFYSTRLYASMGIYCYFLIASIYGWTMWAMKGRNKSTGEHIITHIPKNKILSIIAGIILIFGLIYFVLIRYSIDQSYITLGDAFTTSLNIVALWMASRKWAEQWLLLVPANAISSCLLFIQGDVMSGCLFIVFFIVSIFGYFKWIRLSSES